MNEEPKKRTAGHLELGLYEVLSSLDWASMPYPGKLKAWNKGARKVAEQLGHATPDYTHSEDTIQKLLIVHTDEVSDGAPSTQTLSILPDYSDSSQVRAFAKWRYDFDKKNDGFYTKQYRERIKEFHAQTADSPPLHKLSIAKEWMEDIRLSHQTNQSRYLGFGHRKSGKPTWTLSDSLDMQSFFLGMADGELFLFLARVVESKGEIHDVETAIPILESGFKKLRWKGDPMYLTNLFYQLCKEGYIGAFHLNTNEGCMELGQWLSTLFTGPNGESLTRELLYGHLCSLAVSDNMKAEEATQPPPKPEAGFFKVIWRSTRNTLPATFYHLNRRGFIDYPINQRGKESRLLMSKWIMHAFVDTNGEEFNPETLQKVMDEEEQSKSLGDDRSGTIDIIVEAATSGTTHG